MFVISVENGKQPNFPRPDICQAIVERMKFLIIVKNINFNNNNNYPKCRHNVRFQFCTGIVNISLRFKPIPAHEQQNESNLNP